MVEGGTILANKSQNQTNPANARQNNDQEIAKELTTPAQDQEFATDYQSNQYSKNANPKKQQNPQQK